MSLVCLIVGLSCLALGRLWKKEQLRAINDRLYFFIYYYEPLPKRTHFYVLLLLITLLAGITDFFLKPVINFYDYLVIFIIMLAGAYGAILFMAMGEYVFLKKNIKHNLFILEREFIQHASLMLFHPIFGLAYLVRGIMMISIHPLNGILFFNSFLGLVGLIFFIVGIVNYFLK